MPMEKTFDPAAIEAKWAHEWESRGLFRPARPDATPFTIVNPPPNVTGALHIGHALDNTLQDVLVRYERLRGKDALWVVGMDHAGIATQMVVERQLNERQQKRTDFTREEFVDKVWEWKGESGGQITRQLRRLGCSMDWSREQFTMDPHFTKAVVKVFVDLHKKGLIYRDKRLVNWDPALKTAISDLEVESHEVPGHMWHFKYPLAGGETYTYVERDADGNVVLQEERDYISIATTRPETMLGDGAVAVHPDDERYRPIVGKYCEIPVGPKEHRRLIPIITDEYPDPHFGSGAVKITGAHDENDYGVAQRNGIPMYRLMDEVAAMRVDGVPYAEAAARAVEIAKGASATPAEIDALNLVPEEYRGLDRYEARKRVVADIDAEGLMVKVEDKLIMQPFGDRGGVVIEPMLTDQWYVDAATLAQPPMAAVRDGRINIVPKTWEKTFFNWMENIQPWCVSRQLWWGHRIPAWYAEDGRIFVAETEEEAQAEAGAGVALTRDEDVLDTWFSSALWPFATLGWPENTDLLKRHYPNDVLISGFDILFFWDARMAMQGMEFMGDVPWKTLYLHGLVRAPDGAKMSKSKGNVVDPLGLIDQYGADALRFFMSAMESQGRDIKMDDARLAGYRNFATKLWNAARFCEANGISASTSFDAPSATSPVNRWIIGEVAATVAAMETAFAAYRFDEAANAIYSFAWDRFCDWYLELIKGAIDDETKAVAGWVLDQILVMLHPFMPFITEELWTGLGDRADYPLITAKWPAPAAARDADASADIDWLIKLVSELRTAKAELGLPPGARLTAHFPASLKSRSEKLAAQLDRLARLESVSFDPAPGGASAQLVVEGETITVPLEGVIDIAAERDRLTKALAAAAKERDGLAGRLNNPSFVERAKPEAVEKARADHAAKEAEADRLTAALARLG
ncbi:MULTISPECIES: valine--tRNA ligase [unclassified Sphingopyxis]|jgi:valyl-tRNA synthetase|uniref:valine--tRNA ligase n=1 Tax=unclassified Sphingopyxis TaxID=2614943 RepID=UPI0006C0AE97|nr:MULTISPECIES: valine--tRNA ligase [unclassified Sphingopyxis]USI75460.1 valine--tRNA ligase [Sphingopyxis sp. USTB-05]GAO78034.1 valyl-tRNA synthetase [Sphingopyxis sp. C-1]